MKISLLGYMGCGKTTIGKAISSDLHINFIDLDSYIEQEENISIADIFKTRGEIYFRKKEALYLRNLLSSNQEFVLSLGGGTPCYGNNMKFITDSSEISVYLNYKASILCDRLIKEKTKRPLISKLSDEELLSFISKHLFERNPYYNQANYTLNANQLTVKEIVERVKNITQNHITK